MHRNATEQKLASYIRQRGELTVTQVTSIVNEVETQWTESNSKVSIAVEECKQSQRLN